MAGEQNASITIEVIETLEQPFIPKAETTVFAELTPLEQENQTWYSPDYSNFYNTIIPPYLPKYEGLPNYEAPQKELIINLETTGAKPWESRLMCIALLDPNEMEPSPKVIFAESEEEMVNAFIDFYENSSYDTIIGYNVAFDYRFLYALMQRYRKTARRFMASALHDLMQQQKQVKQEFVFGYNPTGKLDEWIQFLFGIKPTATQEQVMTWWKDKKFTKIMEFNADKAIRAYWLWVLNKVVEGSVPEVKIVKRFTETKTTPTTENLYGNTETQTEKIPVQCTACLQRQEMLKTDKTKKCEVCGATIVNPGL